MFRILAIIIIFQISCTSTNPIKQNKEQTRQNLNNFCTQYIHQLQSSTINILDSCDCQNNNENIEKYNQGIYTYQIYNLKSIKESKTGDSIAKYCILYKGYNCWDGIGVGNYLSNLFFVIERGNGYEVDKKTSEKFKRTFLDELNLKYPDNKELNKFEKERFINEIEVKSFENNIIKGSLKLMQCGIIPCIQGDYQYQLDDNKISFSNIVRY